MEVPSIINKTVINKYIRRIYLKTKGIKKITWQAEQSFIANEQIVPPALAHKNKGQINLLTPFIRFDIHKTY